MFKKNRAYHEKVSQMISWGHWFTLFNIFLVLPIASRYLFVSDWPRTLVGRAYAIISLLGHFSFLSFAVYLLILFPITFIIRSPRLLHIISSVIATAGITLLAIDSEVFAQFRLHLNPIVWRFIVNPQSVELGQNWQVLFIAVPLLFLVQMLFGAWCWQKLRSLDKRAKFAKPFVVLFIVAFMSSHFTYIWADANFYRPVTMQRANFPLSYPLTARKFLERHGLLDKELYDSTVSEQGRPEAVAIEYPLGKISFSDQGSGYNLLMIVVDGMQYDTFKQDMPKLAQFADNNLNFTQHFSTGNREETGLVGLLYGISPTYVEGILSWKKSSALISALNQQNYKFSLLSATGFESPLYRQALFSDYTLPGRTPLSNGQVTQQWQQWISWHVQNESSPWFSYLNYTNSAINEKGRATTRAYQKAASNIDFEINDVIETLQNNNLLNNTVIVITATYGLESDAKNQNLTANSSFNRQQLQVPLIMHWPDTAAQSITKLTSHEDVMTTLMQNLLHVQNPASIYSQGESLFTEKRQYNWITAGDNRQLVITTPTETVILRSDGSYKVYDESFNEKKDVEPSLPLILQVLTDIRRFIAN